MSYKEKNDFFASSKSAPSACTVVRQYHIHQKFTRTISGDPDLKTKNIILSLCSTILACAASLVIQSVALNSNSWGYYSFLEDETIIEAGHFGLWRVCVDTADQLITSGDCGSVTIQKFSIPAWCVFAGICGFLSLGMVIICCAVALAQLFQMCRERASPFCQNDRILSNKVVPVIISMLSSCSCLIFAHLAMNKIRVADIHYGSGFWLQVVAIMLLVILLICTALESLWRPYPSRRTLERNSLDQPLQSFYPKTSWDFKTVEAEDPPVAEIRPLDTNPYFMDPFVDASRVFRRSLSEGHATTNKIW